MATCNDKKAAAVLHRACEQQIMWSETTELESNGLNGCTQALGPKIHGDPSEILGYSEKGHRSSVIAPDFRNSSNSDSSCDGYAINCQDDIADVRNDATSVFHHAEETVSDNKPISIATEASNVTADNTGNKHDSSDENNTEDNCETVESLDNELDPKLDLNVELITEHSFDSLIKYDHEKSSPNVEKVYDNISVVQLKDVTKYIDEKYNHCCSIKVPSHESCAKCNDFENGPLDSSITLNPEEDLHGCQSVLRKDHMKCTMEHKEDVKTTTNRNIDSVRKPETIDTHLAAKTGKDVYLSEWTTNSNDKMFPPNVNDEIDDLYVDIPQTIAFETKNNTAEHLEEFLTVCSTRKEKDSTDEDIANQDNINHSLDTDCGRSDDSSGSMARSIVADDITHINRPNNDETSCSVARTGIDIFNESLVSDPQSTLLESSAEFAGDLNIKFEERPPSKNGSDSNNVLTPNSDIDERNVEELIKFLSQPSIDLSQANECPDVNGKDNDHVSSSSNDDIESTRGTPIMTLTNEDDHLSTSNGEPWSESETEPASYSVGNGSKKRDCAGYFITLGSEECLVGSRDWIESPLCVSLGEFYRLKLRQHVRDKYGREAGSLKTCGVAAWSHRSSCPILSNRPEFACGWYTYWSQSPPESYTDYVNGNSRIVNDDNFEYGDPAINEEWHEQNQEISDGNPVPNIYPTNTPGFYVIYLPDYRY